MTVLVILDACQTVEGEDVQGSLATQSSRADPRDARHSPELYCLQSTNKYISTSDVITVNAFIFIVFIYFAIYLFSNRLSFNLFLSVKSRCETYIFLFSCETYVYKFNLNDPRTFSTQY